MNVPRDVNYVRIYCQQCRYTEFYFCYNKLLLATSMIKKVMERLVSHDHELEKIVILN